MIDLRTPEGTLAELRKLASELQIPGRSKMNKGDLIAAIHAARALRETKVDPIVISVDVDSVNASLRRIGRDDITVTPEDVEAAGMVPVTGDGRPPVKVPDYTAVAAIQPVTFHADSDSTPEPVSPLTLAARLARTRTGRRDYPASSKHKRARRNARKGGRK